MMRASPQWPVHVRSNVRPSDPSPAPEDNVLPDLTADGRLPVGRHETTLEELLERFVETAPNPERRLLLYRALVLYVDFVRVVFPGARLWIDGGFVTHKPEAPEDI